MQISFYLWIVIFVFIGLAPGFAEDEIFLLSYFKDNGQAGVFLAWSEDGYNFDPLNHEKPIFTPPDWEGQNLTRDPSIVYHNGLFHMVWTSNWTGSCFGAATSPNLKDWSKPIQVQPFHAWPEDDFPQNVWAPEVHWNPMQKTFNILWSSTTQSMKESGGHNSGGLENNSTLNVKKDIRHHRTFYTRTTDFQHFSDARIFFNPGRSQIDAIMIFDDRETEYTSDDRWIMAVKHEQFKELAGKNIRLTCTVSDLNISKPPQFHSLMDSTKPWTKPIVGLGSAIQSDHMVEGPTLLKVGKEWRLYFDRFDMKFNRFGIAISHDCIEWSDRTDQLVVPREARHGTVFLAPRSAVAFLQ